LADCCHLRVLLLSPKSAILTLFLLNLGYLIKLIKVSKSLVTELNLCNLNTVLL